VRLDPNCNAAPAFDEVLRLAERTEDFTVEQLGVTQKLHYAFVTAWLLTVTAKELRQRHSIKCVEGSHFRPACENTDLRHILFSEDHMNWNDMKRCRDFRMGIAHARWLLSSKAERFGGLIVQHTVDLEFVVLLKRADRWIDVLAKNAIELRLRRSRRLA
jgi:hypothetical protein